MITIALIDPHQGGHHLMYLRLFSQALLELDYRVIALCADPQKLTDWIVAHCTGQIGAFQATEVQEPAPLRLPAVGKLPQPANVLARWHHAGRSIAQATSRFGQAPDLVFFNWVDDYLSAYLPAQLIDRMFPYPWSGLCFQPKLDSPSSQSKSSGWFEYHQILQAHSCQGVGVLDEDQALKLQAQIHKPVVVFPDVTDEVEPDPNFSLVQQLRQQAQGRKVIGLLGSLNKRKGLLTLLEVAQQSRAENWLFAFVGQLSSYTLRPEELVRIQTIVHTAPPNCFFHLESIPDEPQFNALVNACDVLFAAYEGFPYSSNLLTKAAVFGKPVITSENFCMGKRVRQFRLGLTIPEGDVTACRKAIAQLCDRSESGTCLLQPDFAGYRSLHSAAQVRVALQQILKGMG